MEIAFTMYCADFRLWPGTDTGEALCIVQALLQVLLSRLIACLILNSFAEKQFNYLRIHSDILARLYYFGEIVKLFLIMS